MQQAANPTDGGLRPRSRRSKVELGKCQDCSMLLDASNWSPSMRGETGQRPRHICKACWTARQRRYSVKKHPSEARAMRNASRRKRQLEWTAERKEQERRRRYGTWLMRNYGLTIERYDAMYDAQGGACKICGTTQPRGRGGFHVDHCHQTSIVRGLLCAGCNMMLGLAKDSKETLLKAVQYLAANDNHLSTTTKAHHEL